MLKSLDNSNGIQYYGGNDSKKQSGRIQKGWNKLGDGKNLRPKPTWDENGFEVGGAAAKRSAVGQRSSVESRFGAVRVGNITKNQAILRDRNSTPEQRARAKRIINNNTYAASLTTRSGARNI